MKQAIALDEPQASKPSANVTNTALGAKMPQ
jgi:hypothetical protein